MKHSTWAFIVLFCLPLLVFAEPEVSRENRVHKAFERFVIEHKIQGAALCVVAPDKPFEKGQIFTMGSLSRKTTVLVGPHAFFPLGALTQPFTALCLAQFVCDGQVGLDEPAANFLPKSIKLPSYQDQPILIGDLATNTSALPNLPNTLWNLDNFTSNSLYRYLANYKLEYAPGTRFKESNLGYAFLSSLVARFGHSSYREVLKKCVLNPLNLKETLFSLKERQARGLVIGYEGGAGVSLLKSEKNYSVFLGANGLYSTPHDMLKWLQMHTHKKGAPLDALLQVTLKQYLRFPQFGLALPWKVIQVPEMASRFYLLSSSMFGYTHCMVFSPEAGVGVCFLGNQAGLERELEAYLMATCKELNKGVAKRVKKRVK